jgi:putative ABC transport system permease protein
VILPPRNYPTPQRLNLFADQVTARLSAVPGVQSVALSTDTPVFGGKSRAFALEGRPDLKPTDLRPVSYFSSTPTYFPMLRIPLQRGRIFNVRDQADSTPVAMISENLARTYFPGIDPIGRRIAILDDPITWREIVGVVGNVREGGAGAPPTMQVYAPFAQQPSSMPLLLVRLDHRMANIRRPLRAALDQIDPGLPLTEMDHGLDFMLDDRIANQRFALFIFAVFSAVALALSALGIYGVVAYSVAQRTQEIGIRMALGAQPGDILWAVFSQTGRMIGLGLLIGLAGAVASLRLLRSLLFEVAVQDPLTLAAVTLLLAGVAGFACWLPARRATQVDPLTALRHD